MDDFKRLVPTLWRNQYFHLDIVQKDEYIIESDVLTALTVDLEVIENKIKWKFLLTENSANLIKVLQNMTENNIQSNISLSLKFICPNTVKVIADMNFNQIYFDKIDTNGFKVSQEGGEVGTITVILNFKNNLLK